MSILIINEDMPENCYECSFSRWEDGWEETYLVCDILVKKVSEDKRHKKCPLTEIIRCKDCLHWKHSEIRPNYCDVWDWCNTAEDYCSYAERREVRKNDKERSN